MNSLNKKGNSCRLEGDWKIYYQIPKADHGNVIYAIHNLKWENANQDYLYWLKTITTINPGKDPAMLETTLKQDRETTLLKMPDFKA